MSSETNEIICRIQVPRLDWWCCNRPRNVSNDCFNFRFLTWKWVCFKLFSTLFL